MLSDHIGFVFKKKQNVHLEAVSLFLAILCVIGSVVVMLNREWRINDQEGLVVEQIRRTAGLWYKCTYQMDAARSCEDIDKFWAALPNAILVGRILMILNVFTTACGLIFLFVGSSFTSCQANKGRNPGYFFTAKKSKYVSFSLGGVMFLVSALFTGIAVVWYMLLVTDSYFQQEAFRGQGNGGNSFYGKRYVWGTGLYFGLLLILGQILVAGLSFCSNMCSDDEEEEDRFYEPLKDNIIGKIHDAVRDQEYI